ncbi:hypothetical protein ACP4OV_005558 [Aristida adscensionis]
MEVLHTVATGPGGRGVASVDLCCVRAAAGVDIKLACTVALHTEALPTELFVLNNAASPVELSTAVSNHLRMSTPDATYALGLQGSDYRCAEPALLAFCIVSLDPAARRTTTTSK